MKTGYFLVIHFLRTGSNLSMKTNKQGIFQGKCFFFFCLQSVKLSVKEKVFLKMFLLIFYIKTFQNIFI